MEKNKKVELLAPAGNAEGFYGAIHAGADAVYLGGNRFGARAYAENFTTEELLACIRYGHLFGRKIYLTVNTLLKEQELPELYEYLLPFYEANLDGVIIQDMGVFRFIKEHFPNMELHASTQMTLCSKYGAELLKEMGASRIVPARELSLEELRTIKEETGLELETFIHGAMCYCYSGQCLFSSILGGRSGNRGRCAQPCRLPYSVGQNNAKAAKASPEYPLSLKDMCTIEHIPDLIEAGIDSFKIEGRMKKPEYTAGVTAIYRKYIDRYYKMREELGAEEAKKRFSVKQADLKELSALYIRSEIQDGYYFKRNGKEMVTASSPAYSGSDDALLQRIRAEHLTEHLRMPVSIEAEFLTGQPASVRISMNNTSVQAFGNEVQAAQKQPVTEENIRKQLGKLGDTCFAANEIQITVSNDAFYPLKQINELRRDAITLLEEKLLNHTKHSESDSAETISAKSSETEQEVSNTAAYETDSAKTNCRSLPTGYAVSVSTLEQLESLATWYRENRSSEAVISRIYVDGDLVVYHTNETLALCDKLPESAALYLVLPYIVRESDDGYLKKLYAVSTENSFAGFLVRSFDGLGFLNSACQGKPFRADAGLYNWNSTAVKQLAEYGITDGFCIPYELKAGEQHKLLSGVNASKTSFEKIVYSRIPMMITANCVLKTTSGCNPGNQEIISLTDRYQKKFPVVRKCRHCTNIIYNSVPLSLWSEKEKWLRETDLRLDFTIETGRETEKILNAFLLNQDMPAGEYTTGHEKRGVE